MNKYEFLTTMFAMMAASGTAITLITSWFRFQEKKVTAGMRSAADPAQEQRLARIETAVEAIAVEIERISEAQRFTTRLLADRQGAGVPLPAVDARLLQHHDGGRHGA